MLSKGSPARLRALSRAGLPFILLGGRTEPRFPLAPADCRGIPRAVLPQKEVPMFSGFGPMEMLLIFFVLLLLFGAKRLPELASGMGKGIRDFKRSLNGLDEQSIQSNAQQSYLQGTPPPAQPQATAQPTAQGEPTRLS